MELTPRQKAKDLYNKFHKVTNSQGICKMTKVQSKQCALIAVDEILNNFGTLTEGKQHYAAHCTIEFYQEVKQEINNL
ncbi:MAG: hypothetical protein RLZZ605_212 [Bacteroidota bacterium]|jgi:hypothetical protein